MSWHPDMPESYKNRILTGDCRELAKAIPDESVDLVLCDPPYLKETMHLYGWLGETAARVLKPGGYCAAYCGTEHLPVGMRYLGEHLQWFWLLALRHYGNYPLMAYKRVMVAYKPVLIYSKGKPGCVPFLMDLFEGDRQDKRYHKWGQGVGLPSLLLSKWTGPGDIIFDPFCGGGNVPAAVRGWDRNFIAFEINPDVADHARARLSAVQPRLPQMVAEQEEMKL